MNLLINYILPVVMPTLRKFCYQNWLRFGWWAKSLFVSIIVAKYNIFPRANNGRSREKQNISGEAICSRYQRALSGF